MSKINEILRNIRGELKQALDPRVTALFGLVVIIFLNNLVTSCRPPLNPDGGCDPVAYRERGVCESKSGTGVYFNGEKNFTPDELDYPVVPSGLSIKQFPYYETCETWKSGKNNNDPKADFGLWGGLPENADCESFPERDDWGSMPCEELGVPVGHYDGKSNYIELFAAQNEGQLVVTLTDQYNGHTTVIDRAFPATYPSLIAVVTGTGEILTGMCLDDSGYSIAPLYGVILQKEK